MDFIQACRQFIAIDSTPANGNMELARYAADLCRDAGLHVELQYETLNGIDQANVIARPIGTVPSDELLLQTHLDTVDPGNFALWSKTSANPFNASIYQDTLYGLGAADVKLDFLCKLKALEKFRGSAWRLPCVLVGTFGEEQGMAGAVKLIRKKKTSARRALVGEPTELRLIHALKGLAAVEIEIPFSADELEFHARHDLGESTSTQSKIFSGKAAHSSDPHSGESAILKLLTYLTKLPDGLAVMEIEGGTNFNTVPAHAMLEIDMVGGLRDTIGRKISHIMLAIQEVEADAREYLDESFNPPQATLNIGTIRTFEDHVKMHGCCRLPPSVTHEVYERWMAALREACGVVGASFRVTDYKQPFKSSTSSELVRACQEELRRLGLPSECTTHAATNEANVFSRFGIECLVIGPGRGVGNSHSPDEHIKIEQLHQGVRFYESVIERLCI